MLKLATLNPEQRKAVETTEGPVLILAGAGSGKTRVITFRIAYLASHGVSREHILAVTFTNKAAREMQERVAQLLPRRTPKSVADDGVRKPEPRPTICTFHSLGVRILRQHIEKLGYKKNFVIYDSSEQLSTVRKILASISTKGEKPDPGDVLALLSHIKNGSAGPSEDPGVRGLAEHIRHKYQSALQACNAVDFDDLILLTLRLFKEHPAALAACQRHYRYVMVDEYQDTNASQFQLVRAITREHRNLCVVGDDDQSIYGWRGAEIGNLLDLEKHFPDVRTIRLQQNYRSTNTILKAANAVISNNPRRLGKQLWSQKGDGELISLQAFKNEEEEARTVVELIEHARITGKARWPDQAILFRTNQQSRPLETALRKERVRYHLIGGQSFFDRKEIRDLLAYLKVFVNPRDDVSLLRIANTPARGLSDATMQALLSASQERKCPVFEAMRNPVVVATLAGRARSSVEGFVRFVEQTRAALEVAAGGTSPRFLATWADRFLEEIDYATEVRRSEKTAEAAESRMRFVRELTATLDGLGEADVLPAERLERFLEEISLDTDRESEKEDAGDAVTLITLHSCKGLEFPHVHIVGLEQGLLPHDRSLLDDKNLEEERRLFYVGITRAMQTLTLSFCLSRTKYGEAAPCQPSKFLQELPQELVENADEKARKPVAPDAGKARFDLLRAALES